MFLYFNRDCIASFNNHGWPETKINRISMMPAEMMLRYQIDANSLDCYNWLVGDWEKHRTVSCACAEVYCEKGCIVNRIIG